LFQKPHQFLFRFSFYFVGRFLWKQLSGSLAAFGTTIGGYRKARKNKLPEEGYWKDSQSVRDFIEASRIFILEFRHKQTAKTVKTASALIQKVLC
jgi:hypothetical protein